MVHAVSSIKICITRYNRYWNTELIILISLRTLSGQASILRLHVIVHTASSANQNVGRYSWDSLCARSHRCNLTSYKKMELFEIRISMLPMKITSHCVCKTIVLDMCMLSRAQVRNATQTQRASLYCGCLWTSTRTRRRLSILTLLVRQVSTCSFYFSYKES